MNPAGAKTKWTPHKVMLMVIGMYVVKAVVKMAVGRYVHSPAVIGEGLHSIADIPVAGLTMLIATIANHEDENFPFGLKKLESIGEVVTAVMLVVMAVTVTGYAVSGLIAPWPTFAAAVHEHLTFLPAYAPLRLGARYLPFVGAAMILSCGLSWFVGHWQIRQGRAMGHDIIVADGTETLSDARIELTVIAGIACEYVFRNPWLEYPLALVVAASLLHTAWELGKRGIESLLLRSLGKDLEEELAAAARTIPGVIDMPAAKLRTFRAGHTAIIIAKVISRCPLLISQRDLKEAIETVAGPLAARAECQDAKFYLRFDTPSADFHRVAYAIAKPPGAVVIAPTVQQATHLRICDLADGEIQRAEDHEIQGDWPRLLADKRVRCLYTSGIDAPTTDRLRPFGVGSEATPFYTMASIGF